MKSISDQFIEKRGQLSSKGLRAVAVIFSRDGRIKAQREDVRSLGFKPQLEANSKPTYMGLPYRVDPDQEADILLVCEPRMEGPRMTSIRFEGVPVSSQVDASPAIMLKLVAESLDAAALCDLIMEWLGQDCNWGEFEKELHAVVEKHGTFE